MRWTCTPVFLIVLVTPTVTTRQFAQTKSPAFDAASIKESSTLELDGLFRMTPGRFTVTNLSLRWIIRHAFRLRDYQVIRAPAWTDARYQINATFTNPAANDEEVRAMLQDLLAERFQLRAHREQRNLSMYALVKARTDGRLGPKLTPSDTDCDKPVAGSTTQQPLPVGRSRPVCMMFAGSWLIRGFTRTIPQLVQILDEIVGSPVVDRTGLMGNYDFDVQWGKPGDVPTDPSNQTTEGLAALFTALREQLGLKLDATRGPYDVLVIDSIARPTPD